MTSLLEAFFLAMDGLLDFVSESRRLKMKKKLISLKEAYYREVNKPDDKIDHALIDAIERKLLNLTTTAHAKRIKLRDPKA